MFVNSEEKRVFTCVDDIFMLFKGTNMQSEVMVNSLNKTSNLLIKRK